MKKLGELEWLVPCHIAVSCRVDDKPFSLNIPEWGSKSACNPSKVGRWYGKRSRKGNLKAAQVYCLAFFKTVKRIPFHKSQKQWKNFLPSSTISTILQLPQKIQTVPNTAALSLPLTHSPKERVLPVWVREAEGKSPGNCRVGFSRLAEEAKLRTLPWDYPVTSSEE